jgi:chorismate mutase
VRIYASTLAVAAVAAGALLTVAACAPATEEARSGGESFLALVDLSANRVQIADAVAAAKWGTASPINDPVREQAVLRAAATKSTQLAIDPAVSIQIFTDQIEANKTVQYALYSYWSTHPDRIPSTRPDLNSIRPILDQTTDELLTQLNATQHIRAAPSCAAQLAAARQHVKQTRALDPLHDNALGRALESVCRLRGTTRPTVRISPPLTEGRQRGGDPEFLYARETTKNVLGALTLLA